MKNTEPIETAKNLARAVAVCGEVARLYAKKGKPPVWLSVTSERNHAWKRAFRKQLRLKTHNVLMVCPHCGLPFVGKTTGRCYCPVAKPRKQEVA